MYQYTPKGYRFVDYEAPEPPRNSPYDRALSGAYRRGRDACTSFHALDQRPKNPYTRADFAEAWDVAFDTALDAILGYLERFKESEAAE